MLTRMTLILLGITGIQYWCMGEEPLAQKPQKFLVAYPFLLKDKQLSYIPIKDKRNDFIPFNKDLLKILAALLDEYKVVKFDFVPKGSTITAPPVLTHIRLTEPSKKTTLLDICNDGSIKDLTELYLPDNPNTAKKLLDLLDVDWLRHQKSSSSEKKE